MFVGEVVAFHVDTDLLDGTRVDQAKLSAVGRHAGNCYSTTEQLFETHPARLNRAYQRPAFQMSTDPVEGLVEHVGGRSTQMRTCGSGSRGDSARAARRRVRPRRRRELDEGGGIDVGSRSTPQATVGAGRLPLGHGFAEPGEDLAAVR